MLVDDDSDDQELFGIALESIDENIRCEFAKDGLEGLEKLEAAAELPDFIFLDLNMPRMGGKECLKKIRSTAAYDAIPVIMISTSSNPADQSETMENGANGFIIKPPRTSELIAQIETVFKTHTTQLKST